MVNLSELGACVRKFAPILGSVISSANPLAGLVVSIISNAFGANKDDPQDIISKIKCDENAAQKLQQLEIEHQDILSNNKLADVESARNREVETTQITGKRDYVMETIAILIIVFTFILIGIMFFYPEKLSNNAIVNIISGSILSAFMVVIKYYF